MYWGPVFKTTEEFVESFKQKKAKDLKTYLLKVVEKPNFQKIVEALTKFYGKTYLKGILWEGSK